MTVVAPTLSTGGGNRVPGRERLNLAFLSWPAFKTTLTRVAVAHGCITWALFRSWSRTTIIPLASVN
jgi:hypothetical protein